MLKRTILPITLATLLLLAFPSVRPAVADSELELAALQKRIAELETRLARLEALSPTFTAFMPEFSERFHVLHSAGDAGDWQVASHELLELQRLVTVSNAVDSEKAKLFTTFMSGNLLELGEAIEHGSRPMFEAALKQTVTSCNACHAAAGSPFIQVSLNVPTDMSMRHPHVFKASKAGGMKHGH